MTNINNLTDVDGVDVVDTDKEAFETWSKNYYGHATSLFNVLYQSTDGRYDAHFIQTDWEVWQAGGTSKQAEIDQLREIANDLLNNYVCGNSICGTGGGICQPCAALAAQINLD